MKTHISYAHGKNLQSQIFCKETALSKGGFDQSVSYGLKDIDSQFIQDNSYIFSQPRGAGYWLWKPYLILKHLKEMQSTDWLMYTDSGMYFHKSPWDSILRYENEIEEKGIITFGECGSNSSYCKRDAFILMDADNEIYTGTNQRMASVFVCKKTDFSINFVEEWLKYGCDPRIITDLPNTRGFPNYADFVDHRHDQSIMSILTHKHNTFVCSDQILYTPRDIEIHSASETFNPCIIHTRNPN